MTDQPGNIGDPQGQPTPPWTPPPPPAPPVDPAPQWAPPPPPAPPVYQAAPGYPGVAPAKPSRGLLLPILCGLLAIALIGVGGFSFMTISGLNKDLDSAKASLVAEATAHKAATDKGDALTKCTTALQADETALVALNTQINDAQARLLSGGDFDTARKAYEAALLKAANDFDKSWLDFLQATTKAESTAALDEAVAAEREMNAAKALKVSMESLGTTIAGDTTDAATTLTSLTKQLSATKTTCAAVPK